MRNIDNLGFSSRSSDRIGGGIGSIRPTDKLDSDPLDVRQMYLPFRPPPDDGFDPLKYNVPERPIKPWMAYFNLARAGFGTGMIGIPLAISQAGLIAGPILTIAVGLTVIHTHVVLIWCLNEICRQLRITKVSYSSGFRMSMLHGPPYLHILGRIGPFLVAFFMIMTQIGMCTVFVILTADSIRDIMDWKSINPSLMLMYLPYLALEIFMMNLSYVAYFAVIGNILNPVAMLMICFSLMRDPHGECKYYSRKPVSYFIAIGMILSTMSAVGPTLAIERNLKNPRIMTTRFGVISVGIMVPTLLSVIFGTLGYWTIGSMDENILRYLQYDDPLTISIFVVYIITITITYPVFCFTGVHVFLEVVVLSDNRIEISPTTIQAIKIVGRPVFVTLTFLTAYLLPFQAPFVAFVGNVCTTIMTLVFPGLMEIGLLYPDRYGPYNYKLIKDVLIVALGVTCWTYGGFSVATNLYFRYKLMQSPNSLD